MDFAIDEMRLDDWEQVAVIYREGIETGNATFETCIPSRDQWFARHLMEYSIVARKDDRILGWAAVSPVSSRCVYAGVVENSVYVGKEFKGMGIGDALLKALIERTERNGIWMLQAGIFPENVASLALHKKYGFREVGVRERIGKMNGRWRDVAFLERRSRIAGND